MVQRSDLCILPLICIHITAIGLNAIVRLVHTHLIAADFTHEHVCPIVNVIHIRLVSGGCLQGILRGDATEILAVLAQVAH